MFADQLTGQPCFYERRPHPFRLYEGAWQELWWFANGKGASLVGPDANGLFDVVELRANKDKEIELVSNYDPSHHGYKFGAENLTEIEARQMLANIEGEE